MKKKYLLVIGAAMTLAISMSSCSSNNDEDILGDLNGTYSNSLEGDSKGSPSFARGDMNLLEIQTDRGDTETCRIYHSYCGRLGHSITNTGPNNISHEVYPLIFTAVIKNSTHFNVLQFDIWSDITINIKNLGIGNTFSKIPYTTGNIYLGAWKKGAVDRVIPWEAKSGALEGQIQVVDKKSDNDGKAYITLSLKDLKFYDYDSDWQQIYYTLNGVIDFEICEDGIYPNQTNSGIDWELMLTPSDELLYFMMDALHSDESQGRRTFFSEGPEKQECLIINSEEELREAYKGDKNLPNTYIDFKYCTLVIGRTYGEYGGISLGDYDLVDNGDSYQLNLTLNHNTNPNYAYTGAFIDLYFWKLYPKMEKKPVVFNRTTQDIDLDPLGKESAYTRIRNRWILDSYSDANGNVHPAGNGWMGNERYSIEFMEDGVVKGRINDTNDFSCHYMIPYTTKRDYYNDDVDHGIIQLWDWQVTEIEDNDPLSQQFIKISNATQFKLVSSFSLALFTSPKEWFLFRREGM